MLPQGHGAVDLQIVTKESARYWAILSVLCAAVPAGVVHADEAPKPGPLQEPSAGIAEEPLVPYVPAAPIADEAARAIEARKHFVIGLGELDRRQLVAAKRSFEKAVEYDPKYLAALKELVPLAIQAGQVDEGLDYCRRALEVDPDDAALLHLMASRQADLGKLPESIESLERARAVKSLLHDDPRLYLQIRSDLVQHLQALGRTAESIEPLEELIRISEEVDGPKLGEFARRQLERRRLMDYEQLGRALGKEGRFDEAVKTIEKARDSDEHGKRLSLVLAEIYFDHGDMEKAAEELEKYVPLGLQNRASLELYAKVLDKLGRSKDLVGQLDRWLENDSNNPVLREFFVEKLVDVGEFDRAQRELARLRGRASAVNLQAHLYRKMNDPAKLLDVLTEAVRSIDQTSLVEEQLEAVSKEPELVAKMAEVARAIPADDPRSLPSLFLVSMMASRASKVDLAADLLKLCLKNEKGASNPQIRFQLVELLYEKGRYEEVIPVAEEGEKAHPAQRLAFLEYRARALESLGKGTEATALVEEYLKDAKSNDDIISARLLLVRLFMQREAFDDAITTCRAILSDFPDQNRSLFTRYMLATVLSQKGEMEEYEKISLDLLREADQLSPDFAATVNNDLGYTWADHGKNLDQAEVMIRKALELKPNEAAYLDSMGWLLFKKGEYSQSVEYLRRASELPQGRDAVIFDHLGDSLLKMEKPAEARAAWETAMELLADPKTQKAREQREAIEKKMKLLLADSVPKPSQESP